MRKSPRLKPERWTRRYAEASVTEDPETGEPVADLRWIEVPGAAVTDQDNGLIYRVTIEERRGGTALTFLSIETVGPDHQITRDTLGQSELIRIARDVLKAPVRISTREVPVPGVKPPLEQIAKDYPATNRKALAEQYGVSPSTLDRWLAEARQAINPETGKPYLGKVRPGRPRKSLETPGGNRRRTNRK